MPYSDKAYFLEKMKESELNILLKNDAGTVTDGYLVSNIADADDIINNYLRKASKVVPITPVPKSIRLYSYYIALYNLHDRVSPQDIPERVVRNFEYSMAQLKDIGAGKADIAEIKEEDTNLQIFSSHQETVMTKNTF